MFPVKIGFEELKKSKKKRYKNILRPGNFGSFNATNELIIA